MRRRIRWHDDASPAYRRAYSERFDTPSDAWLQQAPPDWFHWYQLADAMREADDENP